MNPQNQAASIWWGEYAIPDGQSLQCHIGPLNLLVCNYNDDEWQVAYDRNEESDDEAAACSVSKTELSPETFDNTSRYILRDNSGKLHIKPKLADRAVVSRPWLPFNLTAGEEVTLYVSTPIWLEISIGSKMRKLAEIAIHRPSDTWFGSSTREGELCYASRTSCRLHLDELPWRPHRAITPVLIRNRADSLLLLERLSLPVPYLPLHATPDGRLWTPRVTLTRHQDGDMADLKIDKEIDRQVQGAVLLDAPRSHTSANTLVRAFNALFS